MGKNPYKHIRNTFLEDIRGYKYRISLKYTSNIKRRTSFCCRKKKWKSYVTVQAAFDNDSIRHHLAKRQYNKTLQYIVHGMSLNRNKENSGRRRTALCEEDIELVRNVLENNPNLTRIRIGKYGRHIEWRFAEVVPHKCSSKRLSCRYEANLQKNTHAEVWFQ